MNMVKTIMLLLVFLTSIITLGQNKEELIRVVCDSAIFSVTKYPPTLNLTSEQLESIINQEIYSNSSISDSIFYIYICAIINCQGDAEYKLMNKEPTKEISASSDKIISILKSNCQWSAGQLRNDYFENIRVREGNKYVSKRRKVTEKVYYSFCIKFELNKGKVFIRSKINTT